MRSFINGKFLRFGLLLFAVQLSATDVWNAPAFTVDATALRRAADAVKPGKHSNATVLLNESQFQFDETGRLVETRHSIYRVENQDGVEGWSETSGEWEAWHQSKPEIRARVITAEGTVHWVDAKTLNDFPTHENTPDVYSDTRKFGGPLPAVSVGAIVEEEVVLRDTAPLFAAGTVHRRRLAWNVPVNATRFTISRPESLPLHFEVHLLPNATITKTNHDGLQVITLEQGPLKPVTEALEQVTPDAVLYSEIEFSTGTSWKHVAAEYGRLSDDKLRRADVLSLLANINIKHGGRNEIIRRLVAALHKNIRYTGVEFGESSLVPQFPSETLKRKYGDCKDKAALLVTMLRAAGIPANLALLNTGPERDINTELPGMGNFDHEIVYIPASATDAELWVDATAQYSQVGTLPWMDYGRWALVVSDKTEGLTRIPELTAAQNVHRELREFVLGEYGPATIAETYDELGPGDADIRDYYGGDDKQIKEAAEKYVKDTYLADSLTSMEHSDLSDLNKPASIKFVTKGRRGGTDLTRAVMAIRVEALFDRLPKYFLTKEDEQKTEDAEGEKPEPRSADWRLTPFTVEWRYKITAPLGFKLRALPAEKNEKVDSLHFTQKYSANPEGAVVEAVLRVENPKNRVTVQQAKDLRDAVLKARNADPIFITFDNIGQTLISTGKIKEGLAAYRDFAAKHPKEAMHKAQLAQALLTAGLGEQARAVALEASVLEPNSSVAFSTLAMVLKHDLIGRPVKKGMDRDGAIAAYRKAIALDPKDKETRAELALLLEYDSEGTRYSATAPLKDAVTELKALKKLDEDYGGRYDDNVLYDLWYSSDYKGVLEYGASLPVSDVRRGLTLAALVQTQGIDAALKKSVEITSDDAMRSKALLNAAAVLIRVRKYPEASTLFSEAARGNANESQLMRSAVLFGKTKPLQEIQFDNSDPRSIVQQVYWDMISGKLTYEAFKAQTIGSLEGMDEKSSRKRFEQAMSAMKVLFGASGLPLLTVADLTVSNLRYAVEGDEASGYKIIVEGSGAAPQAMYVIRDGGAYRLACLSISGTSQPEALATLTLRSLSKGDLASAKKWLDWARDEIKIYGGEDVLAGQPFPHFWSKGQEPDPTAMRTAALVLLPSRELKGGLLDELNIARAKAKNELERNRLTMVMAYAYRAQERWAEMVPLAEELIKAVPNSVRAFDLAASAYSATKRFEDWDALVQSGMKAHPDELAYVRSAARLASHRGDVAKAREVLKTIIDRGQADSSDMNQYAWYALLLPGAPGQETIEMVQRANDLTKNGNFSILHTAACVYAQSGKPGQARELLVKAMDAARFEEPNSEIWFGFALIAEQYGDPEAATKMYGRVEKPEVESPPEATYAIAQKHLAALRNLAKVPTGVVGQ